MLVYPDYEAKGEFRGTTTVWDCTLCELAKSGRFGEIWAALLTAYNKPFSFKSNGAPLCFSYANAA